MNSPKTKSNKIGQDTGSLIYEGNEVVETDITLIEYNNKIYKEENYEKCREFQKEDTVKWIEINGFSEIEIQEMGKCFNLHPLVLEDINTDQRPKIEEYKDYLFLVLKTFDKSKSNIITKQISLILGNNFVISFQDEDSELLAPVEKQISIKDSIIRDNGADFLFYFILDTIVDSYFIILEDMEDEIDLIEKELIKSANKKTLNSINKLKRNIVTLRKSIWPLNEITSNLKTTSYHLIEEEVSLYFRDLYDHTAQVSDMLDIFRETTSGMLDTYLSSMSNNLNEIVRVLTIITVLFAPITFLTGFFGMNFQNFIPIFSVDWFFNLSLVVMLAIPSIMLLIFKKYKWF